MGANHNVEKAAGALSITHHASFMANSADVNRVMESSNLSRLKMYAKMDMSRSKGEIMNDADADCFSEETGDKA